MRPIQRALISVSDKRGLEEFAASLHALGVELISTGGTARALRSYELPVTNVNAHTGYPEIMDGRVKTLHPRIHGGLLGRAVVDDEVMREQDIPRIDLLVVNLYPFAETIAKPDSTLEDAIENIDIGGPAMLRAAAKNHRSVTVVTDPDDYAAIITQIKSGDGSVPEDVRFALAAKAFNMTAAYDAAIANFFDQQDKDLTTRKFPHRLTLNLGRSELLRYGENPHQQAAFYTEDNPSEASMASAAKLQGKALSYNNIADGDAALECVRQFYECACVIVKHANPCGVASGENVLDAYRRAYSTDPTSAFGGIIAFNRSLSGEAAEAIVKRQFVELIVAPQFDDDARSVLATKPNIRVLSTGWWNMERVRALDFKRVTGGLLAQDRDTALVEQQDLKVVTEREPLPNETQDLLFAWKVAKFVKSNAIVFAKDRMTIGVGAGQMSRVYSSRIAAMKAADHGLAVKGSVMASDAFFPFRDGIDAAAEHGVVAVIQPGGSKRDDEVIAAANEHGMAMLFTGMRHFRH